MVKIPYIKIPSVRVGSIDPTLDIGTGGAIPTSPEPSPEPVFLTQWKIVGNSEVHGNEIWSCGEYNATDAKYHILVQPQGGSIADIALTEPLRKANNIADTIEFPSETAGKALVTRPLKRINLYDYINSISRANTAKTSTDGLYSYRITKLSDALPPPTNQNLINGLCSAYIIGHRSNTYDPSKRCISVSQIQECHIYDPDFDGADDIDAFKAYITEVKPEFIYELATPTTELVDAPQIEEAESYSMIISQGAKAVSWSSFTTNSD